MSLKSWVLDRVHAVNGAVGRVDLPPRSASVDVLLDSGRPASGRAERGDGASASGPEPALSNADQIGAYGPLIAAVREELEHFVASHVRQHVVIADRDRFVLTSVGVRCPGAAAARQLLQQFMHEFKPEQVKRYLAREVIGGLPNATAIDLSQFAGLFDADARDEADESEYAELLAALRTTPAAAPRPYQVSVLGRWTESDAPLPAARSSAADATPPTPLAGQRCELEIEDADGVRRAVLRSVVPGRRYVIGKGDGCDIRVDGTYASRRHAEIWFEHGSWWVGDAGSTNGVRVESAARGRRAEAPAGAKVEPPAGGWGRSAATVAGSAGERPVKLVDGTRIVLSARAEGPPSDYPWLAIRARATPSVPTTPIARPGPKTPLTEVLPQRTPQPVFELTVLQASGARTLELAASALPATIGRSRDQTLVVDRQHEAVSGRHLEIVAFDDAGAQAVVHGDNGVVIEGVHHGVGAQVAWRFGDTMVLDAADANRPACWLTLVRSSDA